MRDRRRPFHFFLEGKIERLLVRIDLTEHVVHSIHLVSEVVVLYSCRFLRHLLWLEASGAHCET